MGIGNHFQAVDDPMGASSEQVLLGWPLVNKKNKASFASQQVSGRLASLRVPILSFPKGWNWISEASLVKRCIILHNVGSP